MLEIPREALCRNCLAITEAAQNAIRSGRHSLQSEDLPITKVGRDGGAQTD